MEEIDIYVIPERPYTVEDLKGLEDWLRKKAYAVRWPMPGELEAATSTAMEKT